MAHFAEINADNIVQTVIVADQEFVDGQHYDQDGNEDSITPLRKNYAGVGYTYDSDKDAFYSPEPYPSWTLNDTTCQWEPPVAYPSDGKMYSWNEETTAWDLIE